MENGGRGGEGTMDEVRHRAEELAEGMQEQLEGLRGYAEDAGEWIRGFARERPIAAVAIAVGLGFLAGRLLSRT
ncbi:hypothetical protein PSR1_03334 [Anaeromyxobacter sp. PSR-1]|nr:hypothetical protein PSR1_03334 [Anaeromyxobacter sp. PSR-1]